MPHELILVGVLPPLLYASAVRMPMLDVRRNLGLVTWLSVGLVIVSALVVGVVVHLIFPHIPFALGVALGAVLSPTDAALDFVRAVVGAVAVGLAVGWATEQRIEAFEPATETQEMRLDQLRRRVARTTADVAFQQREPLTGRGGLVIAWAGMRGVVTLTAAQSIPHGTEHRATLVLAAFSVAVVSLVGFGGTLPVLIHRDATPSPRLVGAVPHRAAPLPRGDAGGVVGGAVDRCVQLRDVRCSPRIAGP